MLRLQADCPTLSLTTVRVASLFRPNSAPQACLLEAVVVRPCNPTGRPLSGPKNNKQRLRSLPCGPIAQLRPLSLRLGQKPRKTGGGGEPGKGRGGAREGGCSRLSGGGTKRYFSKAFPARGVSLRRSPPSLPSLSRVSNVGR